MRIVSNARTLVFAALVVATLPDAAAAFGALAVGTSGDLKKDGYSIGYVSNHKSDQEARDAALNWCRTHGSQTTRNSCVIIQTFTKQCAAEALDPKTGTSGAGWAVAPDKQTAEAVAMYNCRATAGKDRMNFCKSGGTVCDTID